MLLNVKPIRFLHLSLESSGDPKRLLLMKGKPVTLFSLIQVLNLCKKKKNSSISEMFQLFVSDSVKQGNLISDTKTAIPG
jgi:hypothetical protein